MVALFDCGHRYAKEHALLILQGYQVTLFTPTLPAFHNGLLSSNGGRYIDTVVRLFLVPLLLAL